MKDSAQVVIIGGGDIGCETADNDNFIFFRFIVGINFTGLNDNR